MDRVKNYNKAIRDRIPEIIRRNGSECEVVTLNDEEFLDELEKKLSEELDEYYQSKSVEELCDIVEISFRIAELKGVQAKEFERMRTEKNHERGAFLENLYLEYVKKLENSSETLA